MLEGLGLGLDGSDEVLVFEEVLPVFGCAEDSYGAGVFSPGFGVDFGEDPLSLSAPSPAEVVGEGLEALDLLGEVEVLYWEGWDGGDHWRCPG